MTKIIFTADKQTDLTILSNDFIDHYMIQADGEFVKIYLLLLRLIHSGRYEGPDQLADLLELTCRDVERALKYWEKQGLLQTQPDIPAPKDPSARPPAQGETGSDLQPASAEEAGSRTSLPKKESLSSSVLKKATTAAALKHSIFMAEAYLGRPLSTTELNSFCYIDTALRFSPELLEYLIEYCVSRGKKSVRYMESVAISWYQQGVDTVAKAKEASSGYQHHVFSIMKAFGLSGRSPGSAELDYIRRWNQMGFDSSIIEEACSRTLLTTHQASFPYANRILEQWKKTGVRTMDEIHALDRKFHAAEKAAGSGNGSSGSNPSGSRSAKGRQTAVSNAFHNFEQRTYDYDDLEARLLDQ